MTIADRSTIQLVLVAYYISSPDEVEKLVSHFERASRLTINSVIVVDNGGSLPTGASGNRITVVPGANDFYEFSGWHTGLNHVDHDQHGLTILLNDSYQRNWTIKWPGLRNLSLMVADARKGRIAGWLDNFTRTSRRVNSRIVVSPTSCLPALQASIAAAIRICQARQASGEPLCDPATAARLDRWMKSQDGRWTEASAASRWPRIFIEHHLFDAVPAGMVSLRPRTWLGSQAYGIARKLVGERR